MTLTEETLQFHFDDGWSDLIKYDEHPDVRRASSKSLTCIDFLGIQRDSRVFLIEVKNFKGRPTSQSASIIAKLLPDSLSNEDKESPLVKMIVKNVKDSLLFISHYSKRNQLEEADYWSAMSEKIVNLGHEIYVVLWLELDTSYPEYPPEILQVAQKAISDKLAQRLSWLTKNVIVANRQNHPFADSLTVEGI